MTTAPARTLFLFASFLLMSSAHAQNVATKSNLLGLSVQSSVKAPQDFLSITLETTQQGTSGPGEGARERRTAESENGAISCQPHL